jgi:hypothetical protein
MNGPTKEAEWVKVGDRVTSGLLEGVALRIIKGVTIPVVKVKWDNGYTGRMIITNLRKVKS